MQAVALLSAALLGVHSEEDASLLQAHFGKKKLQPSTNAQWIEQMARAPEETMLRYTDMPRHAQIQLLHQFASSDVTLLAEEVEQHREALALALRGSLVSSMSAADWVSKLQNSAKLDAALAKKGKLGKKIKLTAGFEFKQIGGRCRHGREFAELDFTQACAEGGGRMNEQGDQCLMNEEGDEQQDFPSLCSFLCRHDSTNWCDWGEVEDSVCKRFEGSGFTQRNVPKVDDCAQECVDEALCIAFEWDGEMHNGDCRLYESIDADATEAEKTGRKNACYSLTNIPDSLEKDGHQFTKIGGRCKSATEIADVDFTAACAEWGGSIASSLAEERCENDQGEAGDLSHICAGLCDNSDLCATFEVEDSVCKRHRPTDVNEISVVDDDLTLEQCASICSTHFTCAYIEYDNGECELHDTVNADASAAEDFDAGAACYSMTQ
jgi:hypothetical protein